MASHGYDLLGEDSGEFRLLDVQPGTGNERLICTLRSARLTEGPHYETISYCWGDATLRDHCTIDGRDDDIPASSAAALRRLRLPDRMRTLWIDAVCMFQDDLAEKASQVAQMGDIYSMSQGNFVYLGEDDDCMEDALAGIAALVEDAKAQTDGLRTFNQTVFASTGMWNKSKEPTEVQINQEAMLALFSKQWFR